MNAGEEAIEFEIETAYLGRGRGAIWWKNGKEPCTIFCREYEARGNKTKFCKQYHNELLCNACKAFIKCKNLQKLDENCHRHKGCPNCYLIKKHGIEIKENAAKVLKITIHRKSWTKMIDGATNLAIGREEEHEPDQGYPSQGTAGPPFGGTNNPTSERK